MAKGKSIRISEETSDALDAVVAERGLPLSDVLEMVISAGIMAGKGDHYVPAKGENFLDDATVAWIKNFSEAKKIGMTEAANYLVTRCANGRLLALKTHQDKVKAGREALKARGVKVTTAVNTLEVLAKMEKKVEQLAKVPATAVSVPPVAPAPAAAPTAPKAGNKTSAQARADAKAAIVMSSMAGKAPSERVQSRRDMIAKAQKNAAAAAASAQK